MTTRPTDPMHGAPSMIPRMTCEAVPGGYSFSFAVVLPGHDELSRDTLSDAAKSLEDAAGTLRDAIAGRALATDANTGKLLFVPDAVRTSVADLLHTIGKKSGGDV